MDTLGSFVNIKKQDVYFKGCDSCNGHCCDGANGFSIAPLILEDFAEVYRYFPILFHFQHQQLSAYVLLNDGKNPCRYLEKNKCTIYDTRPPACKLYPVSPYFEEILVDTHCPSINSTEGRVVSQKGILNQDFHTKRLENFVQKREATRQLLEQFNRFEDFEYVIDIGNKAFYRYTKVSQNGYMKMHKESLKQLEEMLALSETKCS